MNKTCSICLRPQWAKGYCTMHYQRFNKFGDPLKVILHKDRIFKTPLTANSKSFKKGHIPWCKGKKIQMNTGRTHFKKGFTPWNKTNTNIKCSSCGIIFHKKPSHIYKRNFCSNVCWKNWMKNDEEIKSRMRKLGKKNNKGLTPLNKFIRKLPEYKQWRKSIFQRDNYICQKCFKLGTELHPHHHKKSFAVLLQEFLQTYSQFSPFEDRETLLRLAIAYKPFWDLTNGETMCRNCHKQTFTYAKNIKYIRGEL